jgi:phosphate:Na+ symporter
MQMMSSGMEAALGNKMKTILEKLTANRFLGVLAGAIITAIIQSSSATTVMVVGFVNSGMMTLRQAVWIIMGANIGTTITGQLIALDVGAIAPLIAFIGVAMIVFLKSEKLSHIGSILAGLGILFIGMDMMGTAMEPLRESEEFVSILTQFKNPILGILAGTIFTAVIQSSSASVGILQTLAASGIIGLDSAVYVLFGQNIGTCVTALLAAIGTSRSAKRTTIIHITFNVIGTCIFTTLCLLTPLVTWMENFTPGDVSKQIANMHTTFNIVTTLILIPFGGYLATFAEKVLKDKEDEEQALCLKYIQNIKNLGEEKLGVSALSMEGTRLEITRMFEMAKENANLAFDTYKDYNQQAIEIIDKNEEYIDFLHKEISRYISRVIVHETTEKGTLMFNAYYTITSNIERISDHAVNISGYSQVMKERKLAIPEMVMTEVNEIKKVINQLMELLVTEDKDVAEWYKKVAAMEQKIDDMTKEYRNNMFQRIKLGEEHDESNILFSEMLTDFERIGDHALNISDEIIKMRLCK